MLYRLPEDAKLTLVTVYPARTRTALETEDGDEIVSRVGAREIDGGGNEVVIKIGRKATPHLARFFAREAAILRHLDGAAEVPAYIDHGVNDDRFYLIVIRCAGDNPVRLCEALRRRGMWHVAIRVCLSITQAFGALLARGVLHGDIHPGNVIVDERGTARLVDLAQARTLDGPPSPNWPCPSAPACDGRGRAPVSRPAMPWTVSAAGATDRPATPWCLPRRPA